MTAPTEMSIMDFLFQRDDTMLKMSDCDDFNIKTEMDVDMSSFGNSSSEDNFINEVWPSNPDEFLDSILNDGGQLEGVLDPPASSCSDSGLSSDHQDIDQLLLGEDDDILSSTMSSPGPSVSEAGGGHSSPLHSDESTSPAHQTEVYHIADHQQTEHPVISIVQQPNITTHTTKNIRIQNKPLQTVTILNQKNLQQSKLSGKVIRVQTMSGNPRSILLPVSVKDLRTIKIINTSGKKTTNNIKLAATNLLQQSKKANIKNNMIFAQQIEETSCDIDMTASTSDEEVYDGSNSDVSGAGLGYPRLQLTSEEQRLLAKEGITLPTSYPLTKHEERELKRIRRKIRNKISAQDSRKRKKEYVDGLEDRVKQCTEENQTLLKRIKALQTQNQTLVSQLRRLQALVTRKVGAATGSGAGGAAIGRAQPATCLMVLLLSLALVAVPSLKRSDMPNTDISVSSDSDLEIKVDEYIGKRALLFKPGEDLIDEDLNMEDLLTFHADNAFEAPAAKKARFELPPQYDEPSLDGFVAPERHTVRKYIEPPLDDVWPSPVDVDVGDHGQIRVDMHNTSQTNNIVILRAQEDI